MTSPKHKLNLLPSANALNVAIDCLRHNTGLSPADDQCCHTVADWLQSQVSARKRLAEADRG